MKRTYTALTVLVLSSLLFPACEDVIGLGTSIKLNGPVVTILEPSPNRAVNETDPIVNSLFNLNGIVRSENRTVRMTVTLDYWNPNNHELVRMGREWKWENYWSVREYEDDAWKRYTVSDYDPADADPARPVDPPSWSVNNVVVNWNLPVNMKRMESGDYFITVSAWDSAGNHDSNSTAKHKIKHNNKEPNLRIIRPVLLSSVGSRLSFPNPPDYSGYVFDPLNRPQITYNDLGRFTNNIEDFTWEIEVSGGGLFTGGYEFSFEITNEHDLDNPVNKVVYYSWKWDSPAGFIDGLPQYGKFLKNGIIGNSDGRYKIVGGEVKFNDSIKNLLPKDQITPMQIVTRVKDPAGNEEYRSKGWMLYLPDSDKPYSEISFAYMEKPPAEVPASAADDFIMNRNSTNRNSVAYDDDGVSRVHWTLYKLKDNSLEIDTTVDTGRYPTAETFTGSNKRETWEFTADSRFKVGRFRIDVAVEDIYGFVGDTQRAYFTIASNYTPTIKEFDESCYKNILWGDASGNFRIKGIAQIEDADEENAPNHGIRVNRILVAWIKPNLGADNDLRYQQHNDPMWESTLANPNHTDGYGNKVWEVPSGNITFSGYDGNGNVNHQEEWDFYIDLNLFTDLNIGKGAGQTPFSDQVFRVKAISKPNNVELASVDQLSTLGDDKPPSLEITKIYVESIVDGLPTVKIHEKGNNTSFPMLPAIDNGNRIRLEGTWSEDSIANWSASGKSYSDLTKDFSVTWESERNNFTFPNCTYADGTWSTGYYTFTENNRSPIVTLNAHLKDLNDNPGIGSETVIIETDEPTLIRISSEKADGVYGKNSGSIDIFLEFNKNVKFFDGISPASAPRLKLNNGYEAVYVSGGAISDSSNRITFRYDIDDRDGESTRTPEGNYYNLNVTSIIENGNLLVNWVSLDKGTSVTFPQSVFDSNSGFLSLGGGKKLIIDNEEPRIDSITTSASTTRNHGAGTPIYITVNFNEQIQVTGQTSSNLYLSLNGGNLSSKAARAYFSSIASSTSISFLYTVGSDHDTSNDGQYLGVNGFVIVNGGGASITDIAGNSLDPTLSPVTLQNVVIDTTKPAAPTISGITAGSYYDNYDNPKFRITGLESNAIVEYNLNYPTGGWTSYSGSLNPTGSNPVTYSTNDITISLNGEYNIAARQKDNAATTQNPSDISAALGPVKVDKGAILTRITSSKPDGIYSADTSDKNIITIDMEFRIPVTLSSGSMNSAYIELNASSSVANTNRALLTSALDGKKWTFTYEIPDNAVTPAGQKLNVTAINLDALTINDQNTTATRVNDWIKLADVVSSANNLSNQKNITIISGRPKTTNTTMGGGIQFTGTQLKLIFDRDIYRGSTTNKLIIRQIADGYQIPAVLSEAQWQSIFVNRTDIFTEQSDFLSGSPVSNAGTWQTLGGALYQKGTNGADSSLVSDTTVKYVLKFDVDPKDNSNTGLTGTGFPAGLTMEQLRTVFRAAETLSFSVYDREVGMTGDTLTIDLGNTSNGRPLPVKGARYQWIFPNGFVKDFLGSPNGDGTVTGNDLNLTSGDGNVGPDGSAGNGNVRLLFHSGAGVEIPVIRINKGSDIETIVGTGTARQARQPLTSSVKISSRTPNATITYWTRQTTDNASRLIMRGTPTSPNFQLPNRNGFTTYPANPTAAQTETYKNYWDNVRMRPQSGQTNNVGFAPPAGYGIDADFWRTNGQNIWVPMDTSSWGNVSTYSTDFDIGTPNYSDGGMIIHIRARAAATDVTNLLNDYSYESAYRSVFVYINQDVNGNGTPANTALDDNSYRVWIRGSDNTYGVPTTPDFPISTDAGKWQKIRLLTPIDANKGGDLTGSKTLTVDHIPTIVEYNANGAPGQYLWFWVTWKINVPAFLYVYYGTLPANAGEAPLETKTITLGSVGSLEHFAVFPGRTTAIETRNGLYEYRWYGHSGNLSKGSVVTRPARTD